VRRIPAGAYSIPARFFLAVVATLMLAACEADDPLVTPEEQILVDLQAAYRFRNIEQYGQFLADDFRFYRDPATGTPEQFPLSWGRFSDSLLTNNLMGSEEVVGVKIMLTFYPTPREVPGKVRWTNIDVVDTFLEVELLPTAEFEDGVTLLVDGQVNRFYFRKGRTEADTLATSSTAAKYYIVEWRDMGLPMGGIASQSHPAVIPTVIATWSRIKTLIPR
jgi:hypothetical protein